jgi:putative ABC transport system substrate-binding protein
MIGVLGIAFSVVGLSQPAYPQQGGNVARVGVLASSSKRVQGLRVDQLRQSLKELGYVDGRDIVLENRFGNGNRSTIEKHLAEFVGRNVNVIVTVGLPATRLAAQATKRIPIVVTYASNLLTSGLVASMARPGGNVTGSTVPAQELAAKRLELMTEAVPNASRIALIFGPRLSNKSIVKYTKSAAKSLRVTIHEGLVRSPTDFENVFTTIMNRRVGALIMVAGPVVSTHRREIFKLAGRHKIPTLCWRPGMVRNGCMMSYGANRGEMVRSAARYVVKILRGAKPGDLPIQRSSKLQIAINLKTAKALGITLPPSVLLQATEVIE